jgi:CubicO group peptidase (beta-lactamase class C family)
MSLMLETGCWLVVLCGVSIVLRPLGSALMSNLLRRWRRQWYRPATASDSCRAIIDAHVAIESAQGALAAAILTPVGSRAYFAGRIDGRDSPSPDANTRFEIGSITKTFTATLLVAMARAGLLGLDTPLDELLAMRARLGAQTPRAITLTDLATHRSGLPRLPWGMPMLAGTVLTPSQPYRFLNASVLARWLRKRRVTNVGDNYRYSNLGYMLLGHVLARQTGLDYAMALRRFVLDPLQLHATGPESDGDFAQPHTALGFRTPAWRRNADLQGAGGLHSTLGDMTAWLRANLCNQDPIDARLHMAIADAASPGGRIALGWQVHGAADATIVWHNGATSGSRSFIGFLPARGVGVVVLSSQAIAVDGLAMRLLQAAASERMRSDTPPQVR